LAANFIKIMEFNYWLEGKGFVSRIEVKELILDPKNKFDGFKRNNDGFLGGSCFLKNNGKRKRLKIISFIEE